MPDFRFDAEDRRNVRMTSGHAEGRKPWRFYSQGCRGRRPGGVINPRYASRSDFDLVMRSRHFRAAIFTARTKTGADPFKKFADRFRDDPTCGCHALDASHDPTSPRL